MACAPSFAHFWSYGFAAKWRTGRKSCHAAWSLPSSDRYGASTVHRCNSPGLGVISHNSSIGYQLMGTKLGGSAANNEISGIERRPDHLLVLVHGILASPSDWTYAESELRRQLGNNFLIYVSSANTYAKTFAGIDGAGRRLADEVLNLAQKTEGLRKISFLAHSLGGLFVRYAVAILYSLENQYDGNPETCRIAGLEPINLITLATPHLGVRGRKQLPFLLGVPFLEKLAAPLASIFTGRTGRQLFLTDGKPTNPPLLQRMASDCEDLKFISSLAAFKNRILYANVSYDHMVGWRTSSIRRESELVKPPRQSLDGYKHVVYVQYCPPILSDGSHFPASTAKAKEAAQNTPNTHNTTEYHDVMEEEMIRGLQSIGWKKVDVSFHSAFWPFFAHNNIHVKNEWLHNAGTGVIAHVADGLKQQESRSSLIGASL